jgi:hypothetical protein
MCVRYIGWVIGHRVLVSSPTPGVCAKATLGRGRVSDQVFVSFADVRGLARGACLAQGVPKGTVVLLHGSFFSFVGTSTLCC